MLLLCESGGFLVFLLGNRGFEHVLQSVESLHPALLLLVRGAFPAEQEELLETTGHLGQVELLGLYLETVVLEHVEQVGEGVDLTVRLGVLADQGLEELGGWLVGLVEGHVVVVGLLQVVAQGVPLFFFSLGQDAQEYLHQGRQLARVPTLLCLGQLGHELKTQRDWTQPGMGQ